MGFAYLLDLLGVAVFAATGALVAARQGMDPFGFALVGTVTGIGGGTRRALGIRNGLSLPTFEQHRDG